MPQGKRATAGRPLTEREYECLRGMAAGESNRAIGLRLDVSEDTVKTHVRRVFQKFMANDRANAVCIGFRNGYLRTGDFPMLEQTAKVVPYWKHSDKARPLPPVKLQQVIPKPVIENLATSAGECCVHCRAMLPVLKDGMGDHNMGRRMVRAIATEFDKERAKPHSISE